MGRWVGGWLRGRGGWLAWGPAGGPGCCRWTSLERLARLLPPDSPCPHLTLPPPSPPPRPTPPPGHHLGGADPRAARLLQSHLRAADRHGALLHVSWLMAAGVWDAHAGAAQRGAHACCRHRCIPCAAGERHEPTQPALPLNPQLTLAPSLYPHAAAAGGRQRQKHAQPAQPCNGATQGLLPPGERAGRAGKQAPAHRGRGHVSGAGLRRLHWAAAVRAFSRAGPTIPPHPCTHAPPLPPTPVPVQRPGGRHCAAARRGGRGRGPAGHSGALAGWLAGCAGVSQGWAGSCFAVRQAPGWPISAAFLPPWLPG